MAEERLLRFLYGTAVGRTLLRPLCSRTVSRLCGAFLDTPLSRPLVAPFMRKNGIDAADHEGVPFRSFNACFSRRLRAGRRPIAPLPAFIAPCDALLSAYRLTDGAVIPVKQSRFTVAALLGDDPVAARYRDGICLVFRLCVRHYHRYHYADDAEKSENRFIKGRLHTVRPVALREVPVFVENCREYTVMDTAHCGVLTQVEVGALLVGRIRNHDGAGHVKRGDEKGMFLYGGSTVLLLLERGRVSLPDALFAATAQGRETPVRLGEAIGTVNSCRREMPADGAENKRKSP